jgi:broad specificity phosphatase PhoE
MILDIIFVRHGLSCANVLSKKQPGRQLFYQDPELTLEGIDNSKDFSRDLIEFINDTWGPNRDHQYIIGASQMIRAQETAFHMLASTLNKDIYILPHIGEMGVTYDNYSLPRDEQRTILRKPINEGILEKLVQEKDYRESQKLNSKSDFSSFIDWIVEHEDDIPLYDYGDDMSNGSRSMVNSENENLPIKMVIFTHGLFLRSIRHGLPEFKNNDAMHVIYDTDTRDFVGNPPEIHRINRREPKYNCPDDCRVSRCSGEAARNWGSAGRKEQIAIFEAEKGAKKYNELYNLQKPKTFKNYFKRGIYGVKRLFNRKSFSQRIRSAESKRNRLVRTIPRERELNRAPRENRNRTSAIKTSLNRLSKGKTFKNYLKHGYSAFKRLFSRKAKQD